jgi:hypothetical protein
MSAAKAIGAVLLVLAILLLLAAVAVAVFAAQDHQENDRSLLRDGDRSAQDEDAMLAAAAGGGLGLVLLIVAVVLLASGPKAAASATPGAPAPTPKATKTAPAGPPRRGKALAIGSVVLLALLAALGIAIAARGGDGAPALAFLGGPTGFPADTFNGTVERGASMPVAGGVASGDNDHDVQVPAGAHRLTVAVDWSPQPGGCAQLEVVVTVGGVEVARHAGAPGFRFELAGNVLAAHTVHYQVFPADVAAVVEQPFTVTTAFAA